MESLIEEAIDEGARGFTTGLSYAPGLFATTDELVALAGVAARRGLPYHTHMRYGDSDVAESLAEALETAERSGVELNVSHLYPRAVEDDVAADALLAMLDDARSRGVEVTFDLTIFERGGGAWIQSLPAWARDGGMAGTTAAIRDPAIPGPDHRGADGAGCRPLARRLGRPDRVQGQRPEHADLAGRSVADIARERGTSPMDTALDLVLEDGQWWVAPTIKRQAHLDRLIASPLCVPIGDGFAHHPRAPPGATGSCPRASGRFRSCWARTSVTVAC